MTEGVIFVFFLRLSSPTITPLASTRHSPRGERNKVRISVPEGVSSTQALTRTVNDFQNYFAAVNRILSISRVVSKKTATATRAPCSVDSTGRSVSESTIAT